MTTPAGPSQVTVDWCKARLAELRDDLTAKQESLARAQESADQAAELLANLTDIAAAAGITGLLTA